MKRFTKEAKKGREWRSRNEEEQAKRCRSDTGTQKAGKADNETLGILPFAAARYPADNYFQVYSDIRRTDRIQRLQRGRRFSGKPVGGTEMVRTLFQQL